MLTVVVAFALIGAGVQLARNAEGYKVKTAALEDVAGAPVTVVDDDAPSAAPPPRVVVNAAPSTTPSTLGGGANPGGTPGPGTGGGGGGGGGDDDPTDPELPPELAPIVGLVDDIAGATTEALGGSATESDANVIDALEERVGATVDAAGANLGL